MLYALARPLLFSLDPETAHQLALNLAGIAGLALPRPAPCPVKLMGLEFDNPVGLAPGFDKHAEQAAALQSLGFGFIELGGVTPLPQPGNPRPRLFRLPQAQAIINRYGLNSVGIDAFVANLRSSRPKVKTVVGVNIGKNKDTPNERAADDYVHCLEKLYPHVDYVTLNVSSPNTAGLRDLQETAALSALIRTVLDRRERLREQHGRQVAVCVKVSPDLDEQQVGAMAEVFRRERVDGVAATNTTVRRDAVTGVPHAEETGGLSGLPLRDLATQAIRRFAAALRGEIPLIGVGGILSGADAVEKLDAGASLVQLYSGLIYRGPELVNECVQAIRSAPRSR
jgi:dihydroorotate dehydrogenase